MDDLRSTKLDSNFFAASFELMRKEQQKVLQDKQKLHVDKHKDDLFSDDIALLDQTKEGRALERSNELNESGAQPVSNNDSGNSSLPSQTSAPRPLVPPGFASTILEKNSGTKSLTYSHEKEVIVFPVFLMLWTTTSSPRKHFSPKLFLVTTDCLDLRIKNSGLPYGGSVIW